MASVSRFRTTLWTHLQAAGSGKSQAQNAFVGRYRAPLLGFLRGRGLEVHEAEDVAQDVFLRLFQRDLLRSADANKGRFRNYLLGITLRVLSETRRRQRAEKRGGDWERVPLDAAPPPAVSAEFETLWLRELVRRALEEVLAKAPAQHKLLALASEGLSPSEIATQTERSPGATRVALHRARKRLAEAIRAEVARYCSSEEEFAEEMKVFSGYLGE